MEYKHTWDDETGICTVSVFGEHRRPDDSIELQQFARSFREENDCGRFLFDMTEAERRAQEEREEAKKAAEKFDGS